MQEDFQDETGSDNGEFRRSSQRENVGRDGSVDANSDGIGDHRGMPAQPYGRTYPRIFAVTIGLAAVAVGVAMGATVLSPVADEADSRDRFGRDAGLSTSAPSALAAVPAAQLQTPTGHPTRSVPTEHPTSGPSVSQEPTVALPPTFVWLVDRDTYLRDGIFIDDTFGDSSTLELRLGTDASDYNLSYVLMQFEHRDLPRPFSVLRPPLTQNATLFLDCSEDAGSPSDTTIRIVKLPATRFNIDFLSYRMHPLEHSLSKGIPGPEHVIRSSDRGAAIDVTELIFAPIQSEASFDSEDDPTNLLLLVKAVSPTSSITFRSRETVNELPPRLVLDFDMANAAQYGG